MALPRFDRLTFMRLVELAVVLLLTVFFTKWVEAAAGTIHLTLPEMPLLRRTYLFFTLILLVFLWVRLRGETFAEFGLIVPRRWLITIAQGFAIFVVCMLFDMMIRPVLDPLVAHATGTSMTLAEQTFAALKGNLGLLLIMISCAWLFGGFGEEMLYRGYVMTRFAQLLGASRLAWIAAIFLQAIPFALGHAYQGPVGVVAIYFSGLITGAGSLIWGRNLWPVIIAHGLQDTLGFYALYAGIAHA